MTHEVSLLMNAAREMSEGLIESAVTNAENSLQMSNQIFVLRRMAINVLAHEAYNQSELLGIPLDSYIGEMLRDFKAECRMLTECDDMELLKIKKHEAQ